MSVEEIASGNPYGMRRPTKEGVIAFLDFVHTPGRVAEVVLDLVIGDETTCASIFPLLRLVDRNRF